MICKNFQFFCIAVLAEGGVACKDLQGESYESGYHYIPGPEPCTFCICDNGNPKGCQGFICKLPEVRNMKLVIISSISKMY